MVSPLAICLVVPRLPYCTSQVEVRMPNVRTFFEAASEGAVIGEIINNGQDCANSTRYYIHESKIEKFQELGGV